MTGHRVALIPGDGIGREVLPAATAVLDAVAARHGFTQGYDSFGWSCQRYLEEGSMMPADGLDQIRQHDAILLGAVGWPGVPDHVSLWGLLIPIRRAFEQYVNRRPISLFDGAAWPERLSKLAASVRVRLWPAPPAGPVILRGWKLLSKWKLLRVTARKVSKIFSVTCGTGTAAVATAPARRPTGHPWLTGIERLGSFVRLVTVGAPA